MKEPEYKVRPSSRADPKDVFRIFLSPAQLLLHNLHAGDVCHIVTLHQSSPRPAVVWPALERIKDDVVQTSKALQVLYGLKLDSRISIRRGDVAITDANEINLCEIPQIESVSTLPNLQKNERSHWAWILEYPLCNADLLAPGMTFDHVEAKGQKRSFQIQNINSSTDPALYRAGPSCIVRLTDGRAETANKFEDGKILIVSSEGIGGLGKQLERLNNVIRMHREEKSNLPLFYQKRGGILLHGSGGAGKTKILSNICKAGWRKVFHIDTIVYSQQFGEVETTIRQTFSEALSSQPSVIIIDSLESIAPTQNSTDLAVNFGKILSRELDRLNGTQTLAVGATRSLTEIDQNLRRGGRLNFEIEIPVPDSKSRAEILKTLCDLPKDKAHSTLDRVAARTHGFVGADLDRLLIEAVEISKAQDRASELTSRDSGCRPTEPIALLESMEDAFNIAMRTIQPTAMLGIIVETPETKWSDIGGQYQAKRRIEQAVAWPIKVDSLSHHHILSVTVANDFVVPRQNGTDWDSSKKGAPVIWPSWVFEDHDRKGGCYRIRSELHCRQRRRNVEHVRRRN